MLNANKGTKDAGNLWYSQFKSVIEKYGMKRSTVDHGYSIKQFNDGDFMYVLLATDDCFVAFLTYKHFEDFNIYLKSNFIFTIQTGKILKFLRMRIIQTNHGTSIDQAEYTYDLLTTYFGKDVDRVKSVITPMRPENDLEQAFFNALPLTQDELCEYAIIDPAYASQYGYQTSESSISLMFQILGPWR
jgi:hypothetical protein